MGLESNIGLQDPFRGDDGMGSSLEQLFIRVSPLARGVKWGLYVTQRGRK